LKFRAKERRIRDVAESSQRIRVRRTFADFTLTVGGVSKCGIRL
jgi:hypothetical protein